LGHGNEIKGVQAGCDKEVKDGRQNQGASGQKIEEQLHGPILFPGVPPYGNQRIHGEKRDIVPDKEEKEVHAHEEAENACDEKEEESEELLHPMLHLPHGENACEMHDAGEKNERKVKTVCTVEIGDTKRRDPEDLLHKLKPSQGSVIGKKRDRGKKQADSGGDRAHPLDESLAVRRDEEDKQKTGQAAQKDERENRECGESDVHESLPL
jgi:translation initiation factor 1 (eIF-1/SUI1)